MRRLIIERSAIRNNMAVIKERAQGAALYGVVSGQGGGVGAVRLARLLRDAGVTRFGVNSVEEAQLLREYCLQVRELFQAEIDIRQNRIMKILTIVTTIFLPLSLVAGWYSMNFVGMPELGWKYGYPAVIIVSVLVVLISLWIMKKKKFW